MRGDPGRLRQILINLVGNAIKFTAHGEVLLCVTVETTTPSEVVLHFAITDTGVGIPLDRQKKVFDAFTQVDSSTTRAYGGTGLGLTISAQLVHLMGGQVWVESVVDQGSTFHFAVGFGVADASAAVAAISDATDLQDLPVLVVDDNATNRGVLDGMLRGWGMVPSLAATARDALAALGAAQASGTPFPLVLTDYQMPDADGFTLAADIKRGPGIATAAVVMLTSVGMPGDAARCRELGIAAYLPKPIRRSELRRAIASALDVAPAAPGRPALITRHSLRETHRADSAG